MTRNAARLKVSEAWKTDLDKLSADKRTGGLLRKISTKQIAGALVILKDLVTDPEAGHLLANIEGLVVVDNFMTETAKAAQVVLPAATLAESDGTIISFDRRVRAVTKVCNPLGKLSNAEIIVGLSNALGYPIPSADAAAIRKELATLAGIAPTALEKARLEDGLWPDPRAFPRFRHLKKIQLSSKTYQPTRYPFASADWYIQRRLTQMGMTR